MLLRDPRTEGWPLVGDPLGVTLLLAGYVLIVTVVGPRWMEHRKAYDIRYWIAAANASQVLLNMVFAFCFLRMTYLGGGYNLWCQGVSRDLSDDKRQLASLSWYYLLVRIADFLDTLFFVLRKKFGHVSFLHVVHHVLVVFNGWYGLTYGFDGQAMFCICINSCVHVLMYSYYLLSLFHFRWLPRVKPYLTIVQIGQFCAISIHSLAPLFVECGYPLQHSLLILTESLFFLVLFLNFYRRAYRSKRQNQHKLKKQDD
ncbi:elongation of very long chain fatty acids protein AAEL008004-like [Varroa jacobsoni]|uniref:Elongation of very long chain fatty acids protein n=1 Tax=Varroa destructor TaxID=109461 RepID=A0A7M7MHF4_VARDE|nr:elongation of very long chain fatty acids protein AAEL008004-like [Varroa destructor]XP_022703294.1 elongation of very long chain fatty acids protein AAEL008004-like [Varroa jacobsoni]